MTAGEPRLLILETSSRAAHVALAHGSRLVQTRRLDEARRHARDLAPSVADLLSAQAWRPRDLDAIVVSRGPGSYTGLRVGIMSAKALAYATGCAVLGIDTFSAIAFQAPPEAMELDVLADAQQDKVYVQSFGRPLTGAAWEPRSAMAVTSVTTWLAARDQTSWITGPGLRVVGDRLANEGHGVEAANWDPRPQSLMAIGLARYGAGQRDDLWTLQPLYARPSSAEEKWEGNAR
jgi:tRNA threonylcarbamoyladenosine biosynthesis protein TsaB